MHTYTVSKRIRKPLHSPLGAVVFALASLLFAMTAAYFPEPELTSRVLLVLGILVPVLVIARELLERNLFSILMWYSLIYFIEFYGCILLVNINSKRVTEHDPHELLRGLLVYSLSYLLFLIGYYVFMGATRYQARRTGPRCPEDATAEPRQDHCTKRISPVARRAVFDRRSHVECGSREDGVVRRRAAIASTRDYLWISMVSLALLLLSVVQWYYKIRAAGGFNAFLENAYRYRFGTFAEDDHSNALVVLASNISSAAFPMLGAGLMISWKYGAQPRINTLLQILTLAVIALSVLSGSRNVFVFALIALTAFSNAAGRLSATLMIRYALGTALLLIAYQFAHIYMYVTTAGWDPQDSTEILLGLLAPHGHVTTLAKILPAYDSRVALRGAGLLESVFFFVPRFIWQDKLASYGTIPIQAWAGLPTHYQIAPTISGELVAHWGLLSLLFVPLIGALHGAFENARVRGSAFLQAAVYCIVLPRLLAHSGMGISAMSITIFQLWFVWLISQSSRLRNVSIRP